MKSMLTIGTHSRMHFSDPAEVEVLVKNEPSYTIVVFRIDSHEMDFSGKPGEIADLIERIQSAGAAALPEFVRPPVSEKDLRKIFDAGGRAEYEFEARAYVADRDDEDPLEWLDAAFRRALAGLEKPEPEPPTVSYEEIEETSEVPF